jgi:hypothetical protein
MKTQGYLILIGACREAKDWVGEKTLQQAWDQCTRLDWMYYLLKKNFKNEKWPSKKEIAILILDCIIKNCPDKKDKALKIKDNLDLYLYLYLYLNLYLNLNLDLNFGLYLNLNLDLNLGLYLDINLDLDLDLKNEILNSFHSLTLPIKDIK